MPRKLISTRTNRTVLGGVALITLVAGGVGTASACPPPQTVTQTAPSQAPTDSGVTHHSAIPAAFFQAKKAAVESAEREQKEHAAAEWKSAHRRYVLMVLPAKASSLPAPAEHRSASAERPQATASSTPDADEASGTDETRDKQEADHHDGNRHEGDHRNHGRHHHRHAGDKRDGEHHDGDHRDGDHHKGQDSGPSSAEHSGQQSRSGD
jgi:hypothetical protein